MYTSQQLKDARTLLGVDESTSLDEIKKAYRRQALKYHPDKNKDDLNAKENMQALNSAHELLQNSENGQKEITESNGPMTYADLYAFYEFFDSNWTSGAEDKLSEEKFQKILNEMEDRMEKHEGWIYPGHKELKGISAAQIKRFIDQCEDLEGTDFNLSGQMFRPEVLVALLTCLTQYKLDSNPVCTLDLSAIDIKHPEVIAALLVFVREAKSSWNVKLNKTHLALDDDLANGLAESTKMKSLSLEGNDLQPKHVLRIVENNHSLESIKLKECYLDALDLAMMAFKTFKHPNLNDVSLSIQNLGGDKQAGYILNAFLSNESQLKHIELHSLSNSTLSNKKDELVINPRVESLTLDRIDIGPHTIKRLLSTALPNLKTLFIHDCDLSDEILIAIAEGLKEAKHIEQVMIENTRGLHRGQAAILNAVWQHPSLKELSLYYYSWAESEVPLTYQLPQNLVTDALEKLFKHNKVLQRLDLGACNIFSKKASKALAKVFRKYNTSIINMDLRKVLHEEADNTIMHCVSRNENAWRKAHPEPKKEKKPKTIKLMREAFQHRIRIVKDLIDSHATTMTLAPKEKVRFREDEPRLSIYDDKYVSIAQLNDFMDVVLDGQFTAIDLSNERNLPAEHQGVILDRLTTHYQTQQDVNPLVELNLSQNNLKGQVKKLISLLKVCPKLTTLNLSDVKFSGGEISKLAKVLASFPNIKILAFPVEPEHSYRSADEKLAESDVKSLAHALSQLSNLNDLTLNQGCHDLNSIKLNEVLSGITQNKYLDKLNLELNNDGADEKLKILLKQSSISQLKLEFAHCWHYGEVIKAALHSHHLTHLEISGYPVGRIISETDCFNKHGKSRLTHLSLKSCDLGKDTLRAIKNLPLVHLDLSRNRLYADSEGDALIELLEARADTLESLDLTGHSLCNTHGSPIDTKVTSAFLLKFADSLAKCHKLKSLKFNSGDNSFDVHAISRFLHRVKKTNPNLVIESITMPYNSINDKQHMFNETSEYLKFVLKDMQQQTVLKCEIENDNWQSISHSYENEIVRLLQELQAVIKEKKNPPKYAFFGSYKNSGPFKFEVLHEALVEALQQKDYASFHNKWQQWESTHKGDEIDINIGVYFGFIDECLHLYARAIKQCKQAGYEWVNAYPEQVVLEYNYDERLVALQEDRDQERRARVKKWEQERIEKDQKEEEQRQLKEKIQKGEITSLSELTALDNEGLDSEYKSLAYK